VEKSLSDLPKGGLVERLRKFNGAPEKALQNDELLNLMSPTIHADFELSETYERHPESSLESPMTIYGRLENHEVEAGRLGAWIKMTAGVCEVRMFPGGHFYLNGSWVIFLRTFAGDLPRLRLQIDSRISTTITLRGGRFDVL
jgi:medium-chain acyl-[acyl-carrier-protein] hydrolase